MRTDSEIRQNLLLSRGFQSMFSEGIIINEFSLKSLPTIADLLLIRDKSQTVFEIKSKADSLSRLDKQLKDYYEVFRFIYLIIDKSHQTKVMEMVKPFVGILVVDGDTIKVKRQAKPNANVQLMRRALLLWKSELIELLRPLKIKNYRNFNIWELSEIASKEVPEEQLDDFINCAILSRYSNKLTTFSK